MSRLDLIVNQARPDMRLVRRPRTRRRAASCERFACIRQLGVLALMGAFAVTAVAVSSGCHRASEVGDAPGDTASAVDTGRRFAAPSPGGTHSVAAAPATSRHPTGAAKDARNTPRDPAAEGSEGAAGRTAARTPPGDRRTGWDFTDRDAEQRIAATARYLSGDALEGRGPATQGLELAAEYLAGEFAELGLQVGLFEGEPYQEFRRRTTLATRSPTQLALTSSGNSRPLAPHTDFQPLTASRLQVDLPLVFCGYGITSQEPAYDDYAGVDVRGKAVIILRHEPRKTDPDSPFNGRKNSEHAYIDRKVANAEAHGAAAVLLCTDHAARQDGAERLLGYETAGRLQEARIPVLHCRRAVIDGLCETLGVPGLQAREAEIDQKLQPASVPLEARLEGELHFGLAQRGLKNVLGLLPGAGELRDELLIVGAHYDHLGRGGSGSLAPWTRDIHNGADDNASGVAVMLEVARQLVAAPVAENARGVLFVAFSGEELGLLGSEYYVRNPRFALEQTAAMLNLDMVGRLRQDRLTVYGLGTADRFPSLIRGLCDRHQLQPELIASGYGPSDHASFHARGVPVLHFFTGMHADYHRPSDDFPTLNVRGMRRIAALVGACAAELRTVERSALKRTPRRSPDQATGNTPPRTRKRGLGVHLATQPEGLRVQRVTADSPAAEAGVRAGDLIIAAAQRSLTTVDQLRQAVREAPADQPFPLVVRRGAIELELAVSLAP